MAKETKRKFFVIYEDTQKTVDALNQLENINLTDRAVSSLKQQQELILADRFLTAGWF